MNLSFLVFLALCIAVITGVIIKNNLTPPPPPSSSAPSSAPVPNLIGQGSDELNFQINTSGVTGTETIIYTLVYGLTLSLGSSSEFYPIGNNVWNVVVGPLTQNTTYYVACLASNGVGMILSAKSTYSTSQS